MPISASLLRPKAEQAVTLSTSVADKPVVVTGNKMQLRVVLENVALPTFTVPTVTTANGSATLTASAGSFSNVRVGDIITGTGIPADTNVQTVNTTGSSLTLTAAATASGSVTITVNPGTVDATLYIMELDHVFSGSTVTLKPTLYTFDGKNVADTTGTGDDGATVVKGTPVALGQQILNIDTFLSNARKPRTNS
jgi:hypothetical protein